MLETVQPVGAPLDWQPVSPPDRSPLPGTSVILEPIDPDRHAESLFAAKGDDPSLWTYTHNDPFDEFAKFQAYLRKCEAPDDPLCFAIIDRADNRAKGMASYLRIVPANGVIEIGSIWFGPELQRTRQATEAIYLLARHVFDTLGYRRLEWKCDSLNAPSRRAAERFGFTFEGEFRQFAVYKGRNRDAAWFSMLDSEWPEVRAAFDAWLAPDNFDAVGHQKTPLNARRPGS
ncbi:MAG: GNAT family N-acetyltransferase [Alphaproteobacteria bacterium]|nr:GNAT family N-acetyltransferase [Alphaproteobacteria bacterium]